MVKLPKRFSVGERVFAKVRGYPPWPAKIENITDPNTKHAKYHVLFYGTKEIGTCKIEDLFQYADNKEKFSKSVKRKYFHEGIQELEEELKKNPNPVSGEASRDSETAENVPENAAEDVSEKESEREAVSSALGDDGESGNLIIDEGDKKKTVKRKSQQVVQTPEVPEKKKRGRKSMATILAENQTPKQDTSHDSQDEDTEKNVVSRSGRKIKPKRFHDFSGAEIPIDSSRNDQSIRSRTKSKTEESNENQETPVAPIKKRTSVEKDDKRSHVKDEAEIQNQFRIRTLRIESQMMFLDTQIRSSLGLDQANVDECLEAMDGISELQITPLMLKKHPQIVETIKRLRRYVGNLSDWKLSEEETVVFKQKADEIKKKAEVIYNKFKTLFTIPEDHSFWNTFTELLEQFKEHTKEMTTEEIFSLLVDPTVSETTNPTEEAKAEVTNPAKSETSTELEPSNTVSEAEPETK